MIDLATLVEAIGGRLSLRGKDVQVTGVQLDSRKVRPGDVFAALPGVSDDGVRYVADAAARGAVAVLTPHEFDLRAVNLSMPEAPLIQWTHLEPRRAAGLAAALVAGEPAKNMALCGITGTNGKTTTAHILGHLLETADLAPAVLGTAGHRLAGGMSVEASHTTPDGPSLQRLFAKHRRAGGRSVVMEVSSHALVQERTAGVDFDVAVFTNLSRDHLDYHGDMTSYAHAKARLFSGLGRGAAAVINLDDPASEVMRRAAEDVGARVITYSVQRAADLQASRWRTDSLGSQLTLNGMGVAEELRLSLRGRYNIENALAAAAAARLMGASPSTIVEGLATTSSAPGRMEPIPTGSRGFGLFVDYAHTPDALERALGALRESLDGGRLIVVFGCGGDRDQGKRPAMGEVAARLADVAIVTSDNPRGEAPEAIIQNILAGMGQSADEARRVIEIDRAEAIRRAVNLAEQGDMVLVAGKGHEPEQIIGTTRIPFDDRLVAGEALTLGGPA